MKKLRVLLVTSGSEHCGVREYGRMLQEAVGKVAGEEIEIEEFADPDFAHLGTSQVIGFDIVHLNHHAALHASWREPEVELVRGAGFPVVVTQHDTFETLAIMKERGFPMFQEHADSVVYHEPVAGAYGPWEYIRQGVLPLVHKGERPPFLTKGPRVGTVGFNFGWKGWETLDRAAKAAGWEVLTIDPANGWLPREEVVDLLSWCDATAFLYSTGNSGTSGAIRLGLAARRPLIALKGCRQFRDLEFDGGLGATGIHWVAGEEQVAERLQTIAEGAAYETTLSKLAAQNKLAERDSWENVARRYVTIYESLRYRARARRA